MIRRAIAYALRRAIDFLTTLELELEKHTWRKNYEAFQNGFEYAMDVLADPVPDAMALLVEQAECDPSDAFSEGMMAGMEQWKRMQARPYGQSV